jgi:hypothetical protein
LSKLSINATTSLTFVFTATLFFGSFVVFPLLFVQTN